jgi:hypothetical protein
MVIKKCNDHYIYQRISSGIVVYEEKMNKDRTDFLIDFYSKQKKGSS